MYIAEDLRAKVEGLVERERSSMVGHLGLEYLYLDCDQVSATMPVNEKTKQPFGLLHGGASVALAETLASIGAWLNVDETKFAVVGIEINANHIRAEKSGVVTGTAKPLHKGRSTHVWEILIKNEDDKLVCVSRCTLAVVPLKQL